MCGTECGGAAGRRWRWYWSARSHVRCLRPSRYYWPGSTRCALLTLDMGQPACCAYHPRSSSAASPYTLCTAHARHGPLCILLPRTRSVSAV
eukprot:3940653-Rhodomonas_salina.2